MFFGATKSNQKGLYQRIGICFPNKIWVRRVAFAREFLKKVAQTFCYVIVTTSKRVTELGYWCQHRLWQSIPLSIVIICNIQWKYDCFLWNFLGKRRKNWCVHFGNLCIEYKNEILQKLSSTFFWRRRRFQSTPLEWEMMSSLLFSWFVRLEDDVLMLWAVDARRTWLEIRQGNMAKMRIQVFTMSCQYLNFNKSNCNVCQQHTLVTVTTPEEPPLSL